MARKAKKARDENAAQYCYLVSGSCSSPSPSARLHERDDTLHTSQSPTPIQGRQAACVCHAVFLAQNLILVFATLSVILLSTVCRGKGELSREGENAKTQLEGVLIPADQPCLRHRRPRRLVPRPPCF